MCGVWGGGGGGGGREGVNLGCRGLFGFGGCILSFMDSHM